MTDNVIDISHWEDPVDFAKVSGAGISAIIAKASQGAAGVDATYTKNKAKAAPYNFLWGSYHFGTGDDVSVQVDHYLKVAQPRPDEFVCLDFEPNPHGPTMTLSQAREFVGLFEHVTNRYPVLYGGHWLKENLGGKKDDILSKCPLWLAQYGPKAVLPPGWKSYALWQFTDNEQTIPGVNKTDRDRFDGTAAALKKQWPFT